MAESNTVWIAYHGDYSDVVVFSNELDCLRYAVDQSMLVKQIFYGDTVHVKREAVPPRGGDPDDRARRLELLLSTANDERLQMRATLSQILALCQQEMENHPERETDVCRTISQITAQWL